MNIQQKMMELDSLNWNRSQTQQINIAKQKYSQASSILSALAKDPGNKTLQKNYQQAIASANDTVKQVAGNANFSSSSGGSGGTGTTAKGSTAFNSNLQQAVQRGLPSSWAPALTELVRLESGWNPSAKNPTSTAYGYGQFINSTRQAYEKKMNMSYGDPVNQLLMMAQYVKERYGTPEKALAQWHARSPHWY